MNKAQRKIIPTFVTSKRHGGDIYEYYYRVCVHPDTQRCNSF
jgi:hypothetical protein